MVEPYQLSFSFRAASAEEEKRAINWQVRRLLRAEARCGNELACRSPNKFIEQHSVSLANQDSTANMVVEMYRAAAKAGMLQEPIWAEWMFKKLELLVARVG